MANEGWIADLLGLKEIRSNGTAVVSRSIVDFLGGGVTIVDDPASKSTKITFAGSSGASVEIKPACRCATTANITLSGLGTHDGVALNASDRVLVRLQTTTSQNGIYVASAVGWTRATDFDASAEIGAGTIVVVDQGTTMADSAWLLTTNAPIVLDVSAMAFKRLDAADAVSIRTVAVSATTPAAGDALLYSSPTAAGPAKIADANIASNAAIAISKLAPGVGSQIMRMSAGVPTWGSISTSDFGDNISPATPANPTSNWSPAGWSSSTIVRMTPTVVTTVNGLAAVTSGATRKLLKNEGTQPIIFVSLASGQTAGNQFETYGGGAFVLQAGTSVTVFYDGFSSLWRFLSDERGIVRSSGGLVLAGGVEALYYDSLGTTATRKSTAVPIPLTQFLNVAGSTCAPSVSGGTIRTELPAGTSNSVICRPVVPAGSRVSGFSALVEVVSPLSTGITLSAFTQTERRSVAYVANAALASATPVVSSTAAGFYLLSITGLAWEISIGISPIVRVTAGVGAYSYLYWADVTFDDPGPRNF